MNRTLLILALSIAFTPLAQAQFSGGIVYDPTQAENAGRQIVEGIKLYNTAVQTQQQLIQQTNGKSYLNHSAAITGTKARRYAPDEI